MAGQPRKPGQPANSGRSRLARAARLPLLLLSSLLAGCAALTNPVADGIPVRRLPSELLAAPKEGQRTIPLTLLRQKPTDAYLLESGDVLGVYIEGVLGDRNVPPPVRLVEQSGLPPAMGYPTPVRSNGTISLPLVEPINVAGLTVAEAEEAVRQAYTVKKEVLRPGRERIIVTLLQPRTYHVLVIRQDAGSGTGNTTPVTFGTFQGASEVTGPRQRGVGTAIELPAYENDVLHALSRTGGLPGLDARNEIVIQRGYSKENGDMTVMPDLLESCPGVTGNIPTLDGVQITRIPLRLPPGAPITFKPEDVILHSGDIVFVQSRDAEVFYTGGLLFSGQYPLPRDYDVDVVQAVCIVRGTLLAGGQSINNLTGATQNEGIGFPNPSLVSIVRYLPNKGQVTIRIDLNKAMQDPRERILIKPNDIIILQNTIGEALAQYFTSTFFHFNLTGVFHKGDLTATTTVNTP
jgi:protein involved in polysaccharide export with SLBB domain